MEIGVAVSTWGHNGDWGWKEVTEGLSLKLMRILLYFSKGFPSTWSPLIWRQFTAGAVWRECIHTGSSHSPPHHYHHHDHQSHYSLFWKKRVYSPQGWLWPSSLGWRPLIDTALKTCTSFRPSQSLVIRNRTVHGKETETPITFFDSYWEPSHSQIQSS